MNALEQRLNALERRVAQLQSQTGGGEQLSPNYLTVNTAGQVGASFTGQVNALGIILPESTSATIPPPLTNSIEWQRTDGVPVAFVVANDSSGPVDKPNLLIGAQAPDAGGSSTIVLEAYGSTGSPEAGLSISQVDDGTVASIAGFVDAFSATILDHAGRSTFLQLLSNQELQLAFGAQQLGWAASTSSNVASPAHGLGPPGRVPQLVLLQAQSVPFAAGVVLTPKVTSPGAVTFTMNAEASAAVSGNVTFYWAAIG